MPAKKKRQRDWNGPSGDEVVAIILALTDAERRAVAKRLTKNKNVSDECIAWLLGLAE